MSALRFSKSIDRLFYLTLRVLPTVVLMLAAAQLFYGIGSAFAIVQGDITKTDTLVGDVNNNNQADPGDTIRYTVTMTNDFGSDLTGVQFNDTIDANTTLVGGSVRTTPIARNDGPYSTVGNVQLSVNSASGVLANDNDPDGSGAVTITGVGGCADVTAPFTCPGASANGGDVSLNADGSFTYNPAPGFSGTDTFTYSVQDTDGNSDPATVTITVGQVVWFINNAVGGPGDGRFTSPFNSIANFNSLAADDPGDYIFVYQGSGAYSGALTLLNNQQLIGHGVGLAISPNLSIAAGTRPTVPNVALASGNTVRGLNINASSGTAIGGASVGSLTINNVSVTNTAGVGVSLSNGALAVTFDSVSSSGAANGILLNTTTGSFAVTGTGGTCTAANTSGCSGGTIANMTGADNSTATPGGTGIVLNNATNVSLTRMYIHDTSNYGIRGTSVNGFTLDNSVVGGVNGTNVASPFNDSSVLFDNLSGTSAVTNSDIAGGFFRNIHVDNTTGTLNLTVNNNKIHNTGATQGDDGLFVEVGGGTATLSVTNNTFSAHGGDHLNLSLLGSPAVGLTFTGNSWTGGHPIGLGQGLFILGASFNGTFTYNVSNNGTIANPLVGNNSGGAIHVNKGSGSGSFSGTISNNVIGDPAVNGSGSLNASGIDVEAHGTGTHTTLITNNLVRQFHNDGILILAGEGSATFNVTMTGNTVSNPDSSNASLHGVHFNIGTLATDNMTACLDVKNNTLTNAGADGTGGTPSNGGVDLRMRQRQLTTVRLPGYGGANNDNTAVQNFLTGTNLNAVTTILVSNTVATGGGGFVGGAACPQPVAALPGNSLARESQGRESAITMPDLSGSFTALSDKAVHLMNDLVSAASIRPAYASGETVTLNLGTLNVSQHVVITFDVTIDAGFNGVQVCNQGDFLVGEFTHVATDDPDLPGAADPTCTFLTDEIPPDTQITSTPTDPSNDSSPTFEFTGTDNVTPPASLTFECDLDGGGFTACTSPHTYPSMGDGSHTFQVRAIDLAGNVDPTPASYTWTIDATAPDVTINQAAGQADPTGDTPINFTAVFTEPVTGFGDSSGDVTLGGTAGATTAFVTETAPNDGTTYNVAVSGMSADGTVTASIPANAAADALGNGNTASTSTDNTVTFVFDNTPPDTTIDSGPPNPSSSSDATFTFSGTDNVTPSGDLTFECQLDSDGFSSCASPQNYSGLAPGSHTFDVRAIDGAGNVDPTPASYTWEITATTSLLYNGAQIVNVGSSFQPAALLSSPAAACVSGKTIGFSLDSNPTNGAPGSYSLGSATTNGSGQATLGAVNTTGWMEGIYTIRADFAGTPGCEASFDEATLTVASPGNSATGGGWYTLPGSGRVNFGFNVRKVDNKCKNDCAYKGNLLLMNNGKWKLKGALDTYSKLATGEGAASGIGDLYWWDASLNGGLGDWALAQSGVAYTINFFDSGGKGKNSTDTFGINIQYVPVPPQPGNLPNSAPIQLKGGDIKVQ